MYIYVYIYNLRTKSPDSPSRDQGLAEFEFADFTHAGSEAALSVIMIPSKIVLETSSIGMQFSIRIGSGSASPFAEHM